MGRVVRLLLVDSDEDRRAETRTILEQIGLETSVSVATTVEDGMTAVRTGSIDCVIAAFDLEDGDGLDLLSRVRDFSQSVPFILFPEGKSPELASEAFAAANADYVPNVPGVESVLGERIERLVESTDTATSSPGDNATQGKALERERERFSDLFSNFPEPTIAYGFTDGVTVFKIVNDAFEEVFGLSEAEIREESVNELIVPEGHQPESAEIDDQVDSGDMVDRVVRRSTADGTRIFNLRSIPVSARGEIDGFAVYSDITERKHRERELERYETIVKTIPMGVLTVDRNWNIGNINAQGADVLGFSVDELLGEPFTRLQSEGVITPEETELAESVVRELRSGSGEGKNVVETTIEPEPNVTRELEVHTSLLPAETDFSGVVLVFHDITDRKENERELRRQNERLEEFANIVSHDLRNPLNVAMGHLEIVQDQHDDPSVYHIGDALDRMETLIRETLQLAKQGQMVTDTQPIQLPEIVENCWEMVDQDGATLQCENDVTFSGDPSRVRQLFENLFRNAIDHGGSDVTIRVGATDGTIFVADDGPGIPPDERESAFETGHTTSKDGTGFGLAIVKEIVDAHDWEISIVESETGGARFEITGFERISEG